MGVWTKEKFDSEVQYWVNLLGLEGWNVWTRLLTREQMVTLYDKYYLGVCTFEPSRRSVMIEFCDPDTYVEMFPGSPPINPQRVVIHEVIRIWTQQLLGPLYDSLENFTPPFLVKLVKEHAALKEEQMLNALAGAFVTLCDMSGNPVAEDDTWKKERLDAEVQFWVKLLGLGGWNVWTRFMTREQLILVHQEDILGCCATDQECRFARIDFCDPATIETLIPEAPRIHHIETIAHEVLHIWTKPLLKPILAALQEHAPDSAVTVVRSRTTTTEENVLNAVAHALVSLRDSDSKQA